MTNEPRYIVAYAGVESPPRTLRELFSLQLMGMVDGSTLIRREDDHEIKWETLATVRRRAEMQQETLSPEKRKKVNMVITSLLAPFALVGVVLLVGALGILFSGPEGWREMERKENIRAAHTAAERFIFAQFPGAKKVSGLRESTVSADVYRYEVVCTVDGVNLFNAPVRNVIKVEMKRFGDRFDLEKISTVQ